MLTFALDFTSMVNWLVKFRYVFWRNISEEFIDDGTNAFFKTFFCWQPIDFCELIDSNKSSVFEFHTGPDAFVLGRLTLFDESFI